MTDYLKGLIKYEGKLFWVDLTGENWVCDVVLPDGSRRPAIAPDDVNFFDLLKEGHVISREPPKKKINKLKAIYDLLIKNTKSD